MPGRRLVPLKQALERLRPDLEDAQESIAAGQVLVNGMPRTNPDTLVGPDMSITVRKPAELRGLIKLRGALAEFDVRVEGRVALDAGAAAGGFVQALLEAGAARVYAVEVGNTAFELGQWAAARAAYRDAAALGTFNPLVYRNLALADRNLGLLAEGKVAARKAVELDRFDPANQAVLAQYGGSP